MAGAGPQGERPPRAQGRACPHATAERQWGWHGQCRGREAWKGGGLGVQLMGHGEQLTAEIEDGRKVEKKESRLSLKCLIFSSFFCFVCLFAFRGVAINYS